MTDKAPLVAGHVVRVTQSDGQNDLYDVAIAEPRAAEAKVAATIQGTNATIEAIEGIPKSVLDDLMLPAGSLRKRLAR
jgi:hypothetical protein